VRAKRGRIARRNGTFIGLIGNDAPMIHDHQPSCLIHCHFDLLLSRFRAKAIWQFFRSCGVQSKIVRRHHGATKSPSKKLFDKYRRWSADQSYSHSSVSVIALHHRYCVAHPDHRQS
jgi:hypothetical protein